MAQGQGRVRHANSGSAAPAGRGWRRGRGIFRLAAGWDAAAATDAAGEPLQEVGVTASVVAQRSLDIGQEAVGVVDAISAEDIGKSRLEPGRRPAAYPRLRSAAAPPAWAACRLDRRRDSIPVRVLRARSRPSMERKSNCPSRGSINSQDAGARIVLRPSLPNSGQNCCRYFRSDAVELPSSPPRIRNGAPSTMSCLVVPLARKCGNSLGRERAGGDCCQHKRWQQPLAEYAGGQNVPRRPTNMVLPESNRLYVAFENCEYARRSSSLMLITSTVSCGTHEEIPNISDRSKLEEKSH